MTSVTASEPAVLDVARIRGQFPILAQTVGGKPLAYLDNAATTQKPRPVLDTLARYYAAGNANIHRGVYALSQEATEAYEGARGKVAAFLNAAMTSPSSRTVVPAISKMKRSMGLTVRPARLVGRRSPCEA